MKTSDDYIKIIKDCARVYNLMVAGAKKIQKELQAARKALENLKRKEKQ